MAGLQTCTKMAKEPFYIKKLDKRIYSLEEINFFIYNNINLIYQEFFSDELISFIEKDLERADIARGLRIIKDNKGTVKELISFLLKESHYYSPNELARIANYVVNIDNMTEAERLKIQADGFYEKGQYESALRIYFDILNMMDEEKTLSEAFFGGIAYSIGTIYAKLFMCKNANSYFSKAYELYPDTSYAKACVYMALINNDEEEILKTIVKYHITDEALEVMRSRVRSLRREIETSDETLNFIYSFENGNAGQQIIEQWKEEYYERIS